MLEPGGVATPPLEVRMNVSFLQQPLLLLWPHGGQRTARRNALTAAADHRRSAASWAASHEALEVANARLAHEPSSQITSAYG